MKKNNLIILSLASLFLIQCSLMPSSQQGRSAVGEMAVFKTEPSNAFDVSQKQSRDPASVQDLNEKSSVDYLFALGETYSLEGDSKKAIENFKLVLLKDSSSTTVKMRLALEYVKLGLVSESVKYAEDVVAQDPNHIESKLLLGGLYSTLKLYEKAIQNYKSVIALDKSSEAEAYLYLGAIYAEMNDLGKAFDAFEKVAKHKEDKFRHLAYYYMGRIYSYKKDSAQAEQSYKKALSIKKDFVDAVLALGAIYEEANQDSKAIQLYAEFQEQSGPDVNVAKSLSQLYLQNEQYDKAYSQYEIIVAHEPDNLSVKVRMALVDIEKKEYVLAVRRLKEILHLAPDSDKVRFYLAAVLEEMSLTTEAIEHFEKIQPESQFYGEAVVHAAYLYKTLGQSSKAEALVDLAIKFRPDYAQFYALKGSLLDEKKKFKDAEIYLEKGVALFPENEQLLFFLGSVQDKLGKKNHTIITMKKVIEINENHIQALNYLAYTYAELGKDLDEAEVLAKRALNLKPNDAYIIDTLGWVYLKQGKQKEAVESLEKAHAMNPSEAIIAEHLGDAYFNIRLYTKAQDMYERAAKVEKNESNQRKIESKILQIKKTLGENNYRVPASSY